MVGHERALWGFLGWHTQRGRVQCLVSHNSDCCWSLGAPAMNTLFFKDGCSTAVTLPSIVQAWASLHALCPAVHKPLSVYRGFCVCQPSLFLHMPFLGYRGRLEEKWTNLSSVHSDNDFFFSFSISAQELRSLFEKKSLKEKPPSLGKQSILSVRLEQCPLQLNNPFNEYSKFDGKVSLK